MTEWIQCSDRFPISGKYLVFSKGEILTAQFWNNEFYMCNIGEWEESITHWAELPKPPEEIEND